MTHLVRLVLLDETFETVSFKWRCIYLASDILTWKSVFSSKRYCSENSTVHNLYEYLAVNIS